MVLAATTAAVGLVAGPASADPPSGQALAGVSISCGTDVLTFTDGVQVGDLRRIQLGNGDQIVLNDVVLHDATLTDEAGGSYRAVGSASSTALVAAGGEPDDVVGHFNINITVLGDGGLLGRFWLRERLTRDGTVTADSGGGCLL